MGAKGRSGLILSEWQDRFGIERACQKYLFSHHWPKGFSCPQCQGTQYWTIQRDERTTPLYECSGCHHQTSLTSGTIFHRTKVPLRIWFRAIVLMDAKSETSSVRSLSRTLGISESTMALIMRKIQRATAGGLGDELNELIEWWAHRTPDDSVRGLQFHIMRHVVIQSWARRQRLTGPLRHKTLPEKRQRTGPKWSPRSIILALQQSYRLTGYCSMHRWTREKRNPTVYIIRRSFGSWKAAWQAAGFEVSRHRATAADVVATLQSVGTFVPEQEWRDQRRFPSATTIRRVFGSWPAAWQAAGLWQPQPTVKEQILVRMAAVGRYYTTGEWTRAGMRPAVSTICGYFGSWVAAWEAAGIHASRTRER